MSGGSRDTRNRHRSNLRMLNQMQCRLKLTTTETLRTFNLRKLKAQQWSAITLQMVSNTLRGLTIHTFNSVDFIAPGIEGFFIKGFGFYANLYVVPHCNRLVFHWKFGLLHKVLVGFLNHGEIVFMFRYDAGPFVCA